MKLKDVLACVGWALFFFLAATLVPVVGPLLALLIPLPFLYYTYVLGFYPGLSLVGLSTAVIGAIGTVAGHPYSLVFALEFSLLGAFLAELFRRKLSIGQTVLLATGFTVLVSLGTLSVVGFQKGLGPMELTRTYLSEQLQATLGAYKEMGVPEEKAAQFETYGKSFVEIISRIYPSLMVMGIGFVVWLNVVLARPLFRYKGAEYPAFATDRWQAPEYLVWVVIGSGFALFFSSGGLQSLAINAFIVSLAVYLFQGLSIVVFFLNRYRAPSWLRAGVYCLIAIQQLFLVVVVLGGLFDQWVDFRKLRRK